MLLSLSSTDRGSKTSTQSFTQSCEWTYSSLKTCMLDRLPSGNNRILHLGKVKTEKHVQAILSECSVLHHEC